MVRWQNELDERRERYDAEYSVITITKVRSYDMFILPGQLGDVFAFAFGDNL